MSEAPVLIAGSGPAGLVFALSLLKNSVPVRIIEKNLTHRHGTRGAGIMPRTLELFKSLGVLPEISKHRGMDSTPMTFYKLPGGTEIAKTLPYIMEPMEKSPSKPFNNFWFVSQTVLEGILRAELEKYGCSIEMGKELVGLEQDDGGCVADIMVHHDGHQTAERIEASFVIGADGAKGVVRKILKANFLGRTMDADSMLVGNAVIENLSTGTWHVWKAPDGFFFSLRPYDANSKKFVVTVMGPENLAGHCTPEGIKELISKHVGRDDIVFGEYEWLSHFQPNMRVVDSFGYGKIFLVGDAAHVHSPHGGQGLNTSVQDSFNLAWKISLVYKGLSPNLLESYNEERLPVIAEMLKQVIGLYKGESDSAASFARSKVLMMLSINYRWSSIVLNEVPPPTDLDADALKGHSYIGWDGSVCAGDRAPDASGLLVDPPESGSTLFDLFDPARHTILVFGDTQNASNVTETSKALAQRYLPLKIQTLVITRTAPNTKFDADYNIVDTEGHAHEAYAVDEFSRIIVIRPDGIVGATLSDAQGLDRYFSKILKN